MNEGNEIPVGNSICKILDAEVTKSVALSFKSEHSVRPKPNTTIHPWGEMNTQEGKTGIRHL